MPSAVGSVAVVVCAYTDKRWDDILAAHQSLVAQSVPVDEVVLVIDHNEELLERLASALPDTRVIPNIHGRGLSGARNTGIEATSGDLILFLDDDAVADRDWVSQMISPFGDPAVAGVGGWAVPNWDSPGRPSWFPEAFLWVVGCSYEGQSKSPAAIRNPLGCAMAFRRAALLVTDGFSDGIGRVGTKPLGCEETELAIRVTRTNPGTHLMGAPDAVVVHRVTGSRLTLRYFLSRCYWEGVSKAVVASLVGADAALASERSYVTSVLPRSFGREVARACRGQWAGLGAALAIASGLLVTAVGYLRGRRNVTKIAAAADSRPATGLPRPTVLLPDTDAVGRSGATRWSEDVKAEVSVSD